jgi:hypothetical protein
MPRLKGAKVEHLVIQDAPGLRICGEQNLEAPVESEAIHEVGSHASTDAIRSLEHGDWGASPDECMGASQTPEACADDDR